MSFASQEGFHHFDFDTADLLKDGLELIKTLASKHGEGTDRADQKAG